ncbi:MAG: hypothetical protein EBQ80_00460 [Proteobacteria bacterium]|nr:hypothetical protein [Pseudomonadota bacterium]
MFQSTLHLWRPEAEVMANFMIYYYITLALAATAVTTLIILIGRCDWWGGTVAGALAMAPAAAYAYGSYVWTPFPTMEIPLTCAAIQLLQGALIGLALTALFKAFPKLCPCQSCCGTMGGCCCK